MKTPDILFIQGGGEGAHKEDNELVSNLKNALDNAYKINYPKMPKEEDPQYQTWKEAFDKAIDKIEDGIILIGHSLGGFLLIRYLAEKKLSKNIIGMFFISTPFVGEGGWQFEDMAIKDDSYSKLPRVPTFFYHSTNDETVPFSHLALYKKKIPHAVIQKIDGRGHQLDNNLSEVAEDIKSLLTEA
jgi:predicted alpha/beta hydrolase family esterase